MTRRQQWILVWGIVAGVVTGMVAAVKIVGDETSVVNAGTRAPMFSAMNLETPPVLKTLADYKGSVVLLNIWRTDCLPCEKEMPSLQELHAEFRDRGLRVVAVSVEPASAGERIREFVRRFGLTFEVLHDPTGAVDRAYHVLAYPETYVIGRDGVITRKVFGELNWASLDNRSIIAQLLGEPLPSAAQELPPTGENGGGEE